jgi:hypothetical protein
MWIPLRLASAPGSNVPTWKWTVIGAAIVAAVVGLGSQTRIGPDRQPDLPEARTRLQAAGFHCISDEPGAGNMAGFLVSRKPATREEAARLCKGGRMTAAWAGKAWVTVTAPHWALADVPEGAGVRAWGNMVAFGDEEVLRQLDELLAPNSFA